MLGEYQLRVLLLFKDVNEKKQIQIAELLTSQED